MQPGCAAEFSPVPPESHRTGCRGLSRRGWPQARSRLRRQFSGVAVHSPIRRFVYSGPGFHLREHQKSAPSCNDIDLAERTPPPPCQNAESFRDEECGRAAFGRNADVKRRLPLRSRLTPSGTRRQFTACHSRRLWSERARVDRFRAADARSRQRPRRPRP